ncbi:MAG: hypothetical protein RQ885_07640 [Desulfurococcales archaeon]|nr:hypothetical protein [Desulfurococcales archaeon]
MIRAVVRRANGRYKAIKIVLRIAYVDGRVVERDVVGAIKIGLKYILRWEACGVGLDWGPCGVCEAGGPTPRLNPLGNTIKYR